MVPSGRPSSPYRLVTSWLSVVPTALRRGKAVGAGKCSGDDYNMQGVAGMQSRHAGATRPCQAAALPHQPPGSHTGAC